MTDRLLNLDRSTDRGGVRESLRCDACGRRVTDPEAHVDRCIERELAMFAVGRRAS